MTRGETRWLAAGILAGVVIAVVTLVALRSRQTRGTDGQSTYVAPDSSSGNAPLNAAVQLSTIDQKRIGVETAEVRRTAIYGEVVAPGRVEELETAVRTVTARLGGRVERLLVNSGQQVTKGQPLAIIYSPELATAAGDYKSAVENRKQIGGNQTGEIVARADALVESSRRRLETLGLTSEQIRNVPALHEIPASTTIDSDSAGVVRSRNVTEGRFVSSGEVLYVLIDSSSVSVRADIFSSDISQIRPGLRVEITSEALAGVKLKGSVNSIESRSDAQSGTTAVHIQVENPGMLLRPGMLVRSVFQPSLDTRTLAVPRSAVIDSGMDKIVYLSLEGGVFQRRSIKVGPAGKEFYPVVDGLAEGDKVVTQGGFLIDSQTRISGGMTNLFGGSKSFDGSVETASPAVKQAYRVTFQTEPAPPQKGQNNNLRVTILDSTDNPIPDAQVRTAIVMPAMPSMGMPEMRSSADLIWNGSEYAGRINIGMAGPWNVIVEARRGNQLLTTYQTRFDAR